MLHSEFYFVALDFFLRMQNAFNSMGAFHQDWLTPPYDFILPLKPKPPDGFVLSILSMLPWIMISFGIFICVLFDALCLCTKRYLASLRGCAATPKCAATKRTLPYLVAGILFVQYRLKLFWYGITGRPRNHIAPAYCFANERKSETGHCFCTDGIAMIVDNASNVHICKDKRFFIGPIMPCASQDGITTANGNEPPKDMARFGGDGAMTLGRCTM